MRIAIIGVGQCRLGARIARLAGAYGMLWIDQALNRGRSRSFAFALIDLGRNE